MADVVKSVVVSNDVSDLAKSSVPSECSDTNPTKTDTHNNAFSEIDAFSDLSFKTGDDISLQDIIESEFAARMSGLSAESSPVGAPHDTFDDIQDFINSEQITTKSGGQCDVIENIGQSNGVNLLDDFVCSNEMLPNTCVVNENGVPPVEPDLVAFKCTRPTEMPLMSAFDPFARIEEDSEASNSTPLSANTNNQLNSPDEFSFPESPQNGQLVTSEPMVDLFVKTISDENLDLSDPPMNQLGQFNPSSVESVNNSFPNVSDLTSPDRTDHEEIPSDDVASSEPVDTVLELDDGTSSVSHQVDLSTEETETGITDQNLDLGEKPLEDAKTDLLLIDRQLSSDLSGTVANQMEFSDNKNNIGESGEFHLSDDVSEQSRDELGNCVSQSPVRSIEQGDDSDTISPEDEKSLSISDKLASLQEDIVKPVTCEYARQMAPIATEEEDDWTTVEEALGGTDETQEMLDQEQGYLSHVEEGRELAADDKASEVSSEEAQAMELLDDVLANVVDVDTSSLVLNRNVVTNTPNIVLIPAEDPEEEKDEDDLTTTESDMSTSSEVRTSKKKKTSTTSSAEGTVKRTKKTKKSDEKENISVDECDQPQDTHTESLSLISHSASASDADDLLNVSVRDIMQTYCSEAAKSFDNKLTVEEIIPSPVPIQNLKARSMVDLSSSNTANKVASLRSNLQTTALSRSTNNLSSSEKTPVVTGVSVRALKERYCSMVNLFDAVLLPTPEPRRRLSVPWSDHLKSSFSKFDQLSKKTIIHVRSVDSTKAQKQFADATVGNEISNNCKSCGKMVFQMEQVKAERAVWHKNCFRCKECNKQLTLDIYSSHEGVLYCKPHFKELFKPKAVVEDEEQPRFRKPEMIIRENQPMELPPEVFRASDKPDLGLEELAALNVRSRFQVFEKGDESDDQDRAEPVSVKRSPSILSKLAKFQKKGIDVGVTDDSLNGVPLDHSPSSTEEDDEDENESGNRKVVKSKKLRERPVSFANMEEVKSVWSNGVTKTKEELREERKQEIQQIRSRLFSGKQVKMKEAYEQAVRESESNNSSRKNVETICSEKAKSIKESFEKGAPLNVADGDDGAESKKNLSEDSEVFEAGISKKSRSLFLELDKSAQNQAPAVPKPAPRTPATPTKSRMVSLQREASQDIVRSSDLVDDVTVNSADIGNRFKFFETYKVPEQEKKKFRITPPREGQVKTESPEREVYRDPTVVRAADRIEPDVIRSNTTAKMLSLFRQLEEKTEEVPDGPKPLKCFTPPPDYKQEDDQTEDSEEESEEEYEDEEEEDETNVNPDIIRSSDKVEDDYLKQAANAARAKQLRAKFERWEEKEVEREQAELQERRLNGSTAALVPDNSDSVEVTSIECTKSLRARFESMHTETEQSKEKLPRPKVNRFVELQNNADSCEVCQSRVYPLERVETSGRIFHKACFRCVQCNCLLRLETFTMNCGRLYCMPHFRQLFTVKGNYDEGFGADQHKAKWSRVASSC